MKVLLLVIAFILLNFINLAAAQGSGQGNVCLGQKTCGSCIAAGAMCGWCRQEGFDHDNHDRCDLLEELGKHGCDDAFTVRPDHSVEYVKNLEVQNAEHGEDAVQIAPQEVTIQLRPNKPYVLDVMFRLAENYPVDLYYVMDLSYSMGDDKDKLAELGDALAQSMSEITKNVRLGFGSFVDKKAMPYVSIVPQMLISPCTGCVAPYGFHNQLPLTDDTSQFRTRVDAAPISGNLDAPEGGFDAIMQAVSCHNDIGWRDVSRKLLIFSTDADFHYAGDGKLGGVVDPNDGECHMDGQGYYSESLSQDYPSVSQLSHKIADKKVNVIFAVTGNQVPIYEMLSEYIEGSVVGELANDSRNIVELVRDNYDKISSTVELKTNEAEGVNVIFRSRCTGENITETAKCDGLGIGHNITFEVSIEVTECPADKSQWSNSFEIYPVGLTEKLVVNYELMCECECEDSLVEERNSPHCNGTGTYECGACTCNDDRYGKYCECDGSNLENDDYDAACKKTNTSAVCDGKGKCVCGICDCNPITPGDPTRRYSGKFCDCNNYACDRHNKMLCGGPTNGKCVCGTCVCNPGFNGTACECPTSEEGCRASNGLICNGKGDCECGRCNCDIDSDYRGPTCEDCPTCPGRCEQNKACVQCTAFQSGPYDSDYCLANCSHVVVRDQISDKGGKKMCRFQDDDGCMFYFVYEYKSDHVEAQRTKECPQPVNVLAIVLGVIAGIVLVGLLLLLIWKLLTTIQDRRELAKFEKERQMAKWDTGENPIYKQATSTFQNPTYAGKQ